VLGNVHLIPQNDGFSPIRSIAGFTCELRSNVTQEASHSRFFGTSTVKSTLASEASGSETSTPRLPSIFSCNARFSQVDRSRSIDFRYALTKWQCTDSGGLWRLVVHRFALHEYAG
jgi:hypothetical protein